MSETRTVYNIVARNWKYVVERITTEELVTYDDYVKAHEVARAFQRSPEEGWSMVTGPEGDGRE